MEWSKILAISGKPGLFKMLTQSKNGFIVESVIDGKRSPVFAHERVSSLEEISIFSTGEEDIPLKDVLRKMQDKLQGNAAPDPKSSPEELKTFFKEVLPEYDEERVYTSDIKKVLSWYNLLLDKDLMIFEEGEEEEPGSDKEESEEEKGKDTGKDKKDKQ